MSLNQSNRNTEILTFVDVVPVDFNVSVAVAAGVFMVETHCVQQLVLDDAATHAAEPLQRHHLLVSSAAQCGGTANGDKKDTWITNLQY